MINRSTALYTLTAVGQHRHRAGPTRPRRLLVPPVLGTMRRQEHRDALLSCIVQGAIPGRVANPRRSLPMAMRSTGNAPARAD